MIYIFVIYIVLKTAINLVQSDFRNGILNRSESTPGLILDTFYISGTREDWGFVIMLNNTLLDTLQSKYTSLDSFKFLSITWNVNAKVEDKVGLKKLLFPPEEDALVGTPELIVVGLQEMVALSTTNVIGDSFVGNCTERALQWRSVLLQTLKERDQSYEVVTDRNMVGLWIILFSLRSFKPHVSKLQVSSLGRGVGGVLGNKGAVYARFNVKDTTFCIICAHFAAHRENLLKRNEDFAAILSFKAFPGLLAEQSTHELKNLSQHNNGTMVNGTTNNSSSCGGGGGSSNSSSGISGSNSSNSRSSVTYSGTAPKTIAAAGGPGSHIYPVPATGSNVTAVGVNVVNESAKIARMMDKIVSMKKTLIANDIAVSPPINTKQAERLGYSCAADHDVVIWLGDLNYRLISSDAPRLYDYIDGKRSHALLSLDQLSIEMDKGTVFEDFHEGLIVFDPTYKYSAGTSEYKRERCPAWCDRILWRLKHEADSNFEDESGLMSYHSRKEDSGKHGSGLVDCDDSQDPRDLDEEEELDILEQRMTNALRSFGDTTTLATTGSGSASFSAPSRQKSAGSGRTTTGAAVGVGVGVGVAAIQAVAAVPSVQMKKYQRLVYQGDEQPHHRQVYARDEDGDSEEDAVEQVNRYLQREALTGKLQSGDGCDNRMPAIHAIEFSSSGSAAENAGFVSSVSTEDAFAMIAGETGAHSGAQGLARRKSLRVVQPVIASVVVSQDSSSSSSTFPAIESAVGFSSAGVAGASNSAGTSEAEPTASGVHATSTHAVAVTATDTISGTSAATATASTTRVTPPTPSHHYTPEASLHESIELMVYNRGENTISDHKPVRASFGVKYKK
jgi:hypothetical protein